MPQVYFSFDKRGSFVPVSDGPKFAFANDLLPITIYWPFPKHNWPLKQVFRGQFGPQVKFFG